MSPPQERLRRMVVTEGDNVSDIVRRAYRLEGSKIDEITERAERAIIEANPHLVDIKKAPKGLTVFVPGLVGIRTRARAEGLAAPLLEQALDSVGILAAMADRLEAIGKRRVDALTEQTKLARRKDVKNLVEEHAPQFSERLDVISKNAKDRIQQLRSVHDELASMVTNARKQIEQALRDA